MNIIITGGRANNNYHLIADAIRQHTHGIDPADVTIIHGGASGADRQADIYAKHHGHNVIKYSPNWGAHGTQAGPLRNQEMIDDGADLCLAFPGSTSPGTWDCVRRARAAAIPTHIYQGPLT